MRRNVQRGCFSFKNNQFELLHTELPAGVSGPLQGQVPGRLSVSTH